MVKYKIIFDRNSLLVIRIYWESFPYTYWSMSPFDNAHYAHTDLWGITTDWLVGCV